MRFLRVLPERGVRKTSRRLFDLRAFAAIVRQRFPRRFHAAALFRQELRLFDNFADVLLGVLSERVEFLLRRVERGGRAFKLASFRVDARLFVSRRVFKGSFTSRISVELLR